MLDAQDVVGESCSSQFDSDAAVMMSMPRLPVLGGPASDFRGTGRWLQPHLQRDEHRPERRDWPKAHPSASAMVLARKRKRDEQRRLLGDKRQCTDSDTSEHNDSERDSLDMEEQLTAFVEYNSTDMDSLDINPSQDFDGDGPVEEEATQTQASQYMQTCGWEDLTDVTQFHEEASEVFDNVIYAPPPPTQMPSVSSTYRQAQDKSRSGILRSSFATATKAAPAPKKVVVTHTAEDSDSSLSDGFEVNLNLSATKKTDSRHSLHSANGRNVSSPKTPLKPQWRQRRSVKRDCSFIDGNCSSPTGRLLLMPSSTTTSSVATADKSSSRIIELKDGCFDSSDDVQEVPAPQSQPIPATSVPATVDTMSLVCSAPTPGASTAAVAMGFQPRLVRKRRKVGQQLKLDSFFRPKQR